jgi:hypothetical protein
VRKSSFGAEDASGSIAAETGDHGVVVDAVIFTSPSRFL